MGWGRVGRRPWTTAQGLPAGPPRREAVRVDRGGQVVLSRDCSPVVKEGFAHRSHGRAVMQNRDGSARRAACSAIAALGQGSTRDEASASIPGAHDPANWRSDREGRGALDGPPRRPARAHVPARQGVRAARAMRRRTALGAPVGRTGPAPGRTSARPASALAPRSRRASRGPAEEVRDAMPHGSAIRGRSPADAACPEIRPCGTAEPPPGAGRGPTALRGPACLP